MTLLLKIVRIVVVIIEGIYLAYSKKGLQDPDNIDLEDLDDIKY